MKREMKRSTFCLLMLLMNICIWFVLSFILFDDVAVRGYYQGQLSEVLEKFSQSEDGVNQSVIAIKHYRNDDAAPQKDDVVTAIEFVDGDDVLFYKGKIHEQTLIGERVQTNRRVSNVFMGIYCTIFAVFYLIARLEEKRARKAFDRDTQEE